MKTKLDQLNLDNKQVLLRADLNVPLKDKIIKDDFRLQAILPTIDLIAKKGGKIILVTHLGRPKKPQPELSTELLLPWFKKHGYEIVFAKDFDQAKELSKEKNNKIILLENLRFFPGEKSGDSLFAQQLKDLADYYVNDAFATLHRVE